MGYMVDMKSRVIESIGGSFSFVRGSIARLADMTVGEFHYLVERKELYFRNRELRHVIDGLCDRKSVCYCERGPIYRRDIRDVMHRVALIKAECRRIQREMDACRGHGR